MDAGKIIQDVQLKLQFIIFMLRHLFRNAPYRVCKIFMHLLMVPYALSSAVFPGSKESSDNGRVEFTILSYGNTLPKFFLWWGNLGIYFIESLGIGEFLQIIWVILFPVRKLKNDEKSAYQDICSLGNIPYSNICVHVNSPICRINGGRAVASMNIVHLPENRYSLDLVVHELTHIVQYTRIGANYMLEALYAQFWGAGYNYGDLSEARARNQKFSHFNREQQAQIIQDYYRLLHGKYAKYGASQAELTPYIKDFNEGRI